MQRLRGLPGRLVQGGRLLLASHVVHEMPDRVARRRHGRIGL